MRLAAQTISSPLAATAGLDGGDYITVQLSQEWWKLMLVN
jgi:hypothetical protein